MTTRQTAIEQYMALALQPVMVGAHERADIFRNLDHIAELAFAAKNVTEIELPVRLYTLPEGALRLWLALPCAEVPQWSWGIP